MTTTQLTKPRPAEDTLIDALRGCRDVKELKALDKEVRNEVDDHLAEALAGPIPPPEELYENIFIEDATARGIELADSHIVA